MTAVRSYAAQKGALTRALRTPDPAARAGAVVAECRRVVIEWDTLPYGWPDDWARWNRALSDVFPWPNAAPSLDDIAWAVRASRVGRSLDAGAEDPDSGCA